jgi:tetratricopeptide (TPR) repeat protein
MATWRAGPWGAIGRATTYARPLTEPWTLLIRQGEEALVHGRLRECERLAGEAAQLRPDEPAPAVLAVAACRERGRAAEAEVRLRSVLVDHPDLADGQALLGALLADLGRDAEARRQLDQVAATELTPAVAALGAETAAALMSRDHAQLLVAPLEAHSPAGAGWCGSVARHLGLIAHTVGRWDEAEAHFRVALEANARAAAPVLVAHTHRDYSALLRVRGGPGDWELATHLLAEAAAVYRRLEIGPLAEYADAVLRRSHDPGAGAEDALNVFRRTSGGWELVFEGQRAEVAAGAGVGHIAALLGAAGRPVQALDLVDAGADLATEYRARLAELDRQGAGAADPLVAALAGAERDLVRAELATPEDDATDRARRLVALRIRTALDQVELALPALGHHLRRSIRTGTFCVYEPQRPERWQVSPR